jgi:hypothetical protein
MSVARARATGLLLLATVPSSSQHRTRSGQAAQCSSYEQYSGKCRHVTWMDGTDGYRLTVVSRCGRSAGPCGHVPVQRRLIEKTATEGPAANSRPGRRRLLPWSSWPVLPWRHAVQQSDECRCCSQPSLQKLRARQADATQTHTHTLQKPEGIVGERTRGILSPC